MIKKFFIGLLIIILLLEGVSCATDVSTTDSEANNTDLAYKIAYYQQQLGTYWGDNITETTASNLSGWLYGNGSNINASWDLVADILYGNGTYIRFGDASTTSHSLASEDDVMMTGKCEIDGRLYIDETIDVRERGDLQITTNSASGGITIYNDSDGNLGAELRGKSVSASPADNDIVFDIVAEGRDDNLNGVSYGYMRFQALDVTDGSETGRWELYLCDNGTSNRAMYVSANGTIYADMGYDTFDDFDDAELLREGISNDNKQLLVNAGILEIVQEYREMKIEDITQRVYVGDDYHVNLQAMVNLLAGGIYQNRDYIESLEFRISELEKQISK